MSTEHLPSDMDRDGQSGTPMDRIGTRMGSQADWTAADLAERLPLRPREIQLAAERGELPCVWIGNRPMFSPADIERWLEDSSHRPQSRIQVENVELPKAPVPYQRADGRWSVRLLCPDGKERRFISRGREPIQPAHREVPGRSLSARTRYEVLTRDGYRCTYCGAPAPEVRLHVDHIVPVAAGGTDELENLVTACADCNQGKGAA